MENKKTIWSLQNDKRTEAERNVFKPTGKTPKSKTTSYLFWAVIVIFAASFSLTFLQEESIEVCLTSTFCFDSKADVLLYACYIFINILIVVVAIFCAYIIGKKIGKRFQL
jgi:CDP-diglyceride synthetase